MGGAGVGVILCQELTLDPTTITGAQWHEINQRLAYFWIFLAAMAGFGFSFLMAHAVIPSLVFTRDLPDQATRARKLFYAGAAGLFAIAVVFLVLALGVFRTIREIYPRWWM